MKHVLNFFHTSLELPWAWSIVATTVVVRMILVPLTIRQLHSMQALQAHAPEMKRIQQKYKHDKQKQNEELMKFYRENKINPAASCLPMLAQFPVFIALYYTLKHFDTNFLCTTRDEPRTRTLRATRSCSHDLSFLHFIPSITDDYALGRLRAARRLRREPDGVGPLHGADRAEVAAHHLHGHAARLRVRHRALPRGSRPLLGDDEPLDGRAGAHHAAARAADSRAGARAPLLPDAAEGRRHER